MGDTIDKIQNDPIRKIRNNEAAGGVPTKDALSLPGVAGGPVEAQEPSLPFCGIAFVGEAPGRDEVAEGITFAGAAGKRLDQGLLDAGIDRKACFVGNPFRYRPENNLIGSFFAPPAKATAEKIEVNSRLPMYMSGHCLVPLDEDVRILWRRLRALNPRAIVALGNTALWALCFQIGVTKLAGTRMATKACPGAVVVPTFHPAYLLRRRTASDDAAFASHLRLAARIAKGEAGPSP